MRECEGYRHKDSRTEEAVIRERPAADPAENTPAPAPPPPAVALPTKEEIESIVVPLKKRKHVKKKGILKQDSDVFK